MAYQLECLRKENYLELVGSKGYYKHFESALFHDSINVGKGGMREYTRQVKNIKYHKTQVRTDVDKIISRLKSK
jgi:hypothetical protein